MESFVAPRRSFARSGLAALAAILSAAAVQAEDIPVLGAVEVKAGADGLVGEASSASEGRVGAAEIAQRPLLRPGEVLETIPGVIITQHSGDGKANQYFLRGFNLDHGTDFAVSVMGMPVNMVSHGHSQGYADLNFLIPELVEEMQFRKGAYAAEQGDFANTGSAAIEYRRQLDAPFAEASIGRHGYRRTLLAGSPESGEGKLLYALEWMANDGPWVLPEDFRKLNGLLRYSRGSRDDGWSVAAMAYDAKWNSTDQVPERAITSGQISRFGYIDPTDGGSTKRFSLSGDWATRDRDSLTRAHAYVIDYRLQLFNNFTYYSDPVRGDQFEQTDHRQVAGLGASRTWLGDWGGRAMENTLGLQGRYDRIGKVGLYFTTARDRYLTGREDRVDEGSLALYGENQIQWHGKLRSTVGLRADLYRFAVDSDRPENSGRKTDHLLSPKLGLVFGPWARTEYYANAGYGFHSNDARGVTQQLNTDPRSPDYLGPAAAVQALTRSKGYEIGVRSALLPRLQTSLALWRLDLDSELFYNGETGSTEAGRPSRRVGLEWSNRWTPLSWLSVDADWSVANARYSDGAPEGRHIPDAIERTLSAGIFVDNRGPWSGALRLRYFGSRPLTEDNSVRAPASTLVNIKVGYRVDRQWQISGDLINALDRKVSDIDYWYASQLRGESAPVNDFHVHPAEPRTLRLTLRASF